MRGQTLAARSFWWDRTRSGDTDVNPLRAVIFDVDGAVADLERDGERAAFNEAFGAHGFDISWDVDHYARLRSITDEQRRIATDLRSRGFGPEARVLAAELQSTKDAVFAECVLEGDVVARSGLLDSVMSLFVAGVWVGVVSTGAREWVQPLVRQLIGDGIVETIVTRDDVTGCDPSTDVYELALWELGVGVESALAVVGSGAGLRAASDVGLAAVAVPTDYTASDDFAGAVAVRSCYDDAQPLLAADCQRLHRNWYANRPRPVAA